MATVGTRSDTGDATAGWVAGAYLAFVSSWARFAVGDLAVVDVARLNCRSGPGLDADVIYVMEGGTEVEILAGPSAADGYHWYKVQTDDGDVGWVVGEALVPWSEPTGSFGKGDDVVVDTDRLNLRLGAGLSKTVVDVLPRGLDLIVSNGPMAADGYEWYEVETPDGRLGWVAGDYLAAAPGLGFASGTPSASPTVARTCATSRAWMATCSASWRTTKSCWSGGPVQADGYTWYRVWKFGGEGWAAGEFLRFEPDGFPDGEVS